MLSLRHSHVGDHPSGVIEHEHILWTRGSRQAASVLIVQAGPAVHSMARSQAGSEEWGSLIPLLGCRHLARKFPTTPLAREGRRRATGG